MCGNLYVQEDFDFIIHKAFSENNFPICTIYTNALCIHTYEMSRG